MYTPPRRLIAATAALVSALFLAGCADDDDPIASPSEPVASQSPTASAAPSVDDFCNAKVAIDAAFLAGGPPEEDGATPSPEQIGQALTATWSDLYEEYKRTAQSEVASAVDTQVKALEAAIDEGNGEFFFEPDFAAADKTVDDFLAEECGFNKLSGTTVDYEFEGLPTVTPAGLTALSINNEGDEFHEIALIKINEGVEESVEELLELDEEELMSKIQPMGVVLAMPGTSATNFFDLEAGRYAVLCFISKDSDAEHDFQGEGPPHFTEGMLEELRVLGEGEASAAPTSTTSSGSESGSASEAEETSSSSGSASEAETSSPRPTSS